MGFFTSVHENTQQYNRATRIKRAALFRKEKLQGLRDHLRNLIAKRNRITYEIEDLEFVIRRRMKQTSKDLAESYSPNGEQPRTLFQIVGETCSLSELQSEIDQLILEGDQIAQELLDLIEISTQKR